MKRIQVELLALGFAFGTMALFADHAPPSDRGAPRGADGVADHGANRMDSMCVSEPKARAESALYLDGPVTQAHLDRDHARWQITDGRTTAWLDARSGELLEVELRPSR